ncbi:MAG: ABC transporter ATP-binding protein [Rhodocyclaceae bacterium]|nr:ABC transporter ATP-binding protein [Rhodocyclaceae bacterium]
MTAHTLLRVSQVGKAFGGVQALKDVSMTLNRGEIYGLIGPNGAGKTTLFNCLTGLYVPDSGEFVFDDQPLISSAPDKTVRQGVARTFQNIRLFANMTALENVMVGRHARLRSNIISDILRTPFNRREEQTTEDQALQLMRYVGIAHRAHDLAKHLSYGDQRRLEIARALATQPKLLCLDEPAAGMNANETDGLRQLIEMIRLDGISVLLIEHDVQLVMGLCDRIAVLDYGELICEDIPSVVQKHPRVIEAYLGSGAHA